MSEELKNTQEEEVKTSPEGTTEEKPTIGDLIGESDVKETKEELKTVGLDKFLQEKKARKELERELKNLRKTIEEGGSQEDISTSLDSIAEEYPDVDPKFLNKLAKAIKQETEKEIEAKISDKIRPIEERDRAKEARNAFDKGFAEAMESLPEYEGIVNKDIIFKLALLKENGKKTFEQLIEETYSNALGGKRTIETTTPRGGKEPEPLDFNRAKTDSEYYKEIMADPKLKAEYNANLLKNMTF